MSRRLENLIGNDVGYERHYAEVGLHFHEGGYGALPSQPSELENGDSAFLGLLLDGVGGPSLPIRGAEDRHDVLAVVRKRGQHVLSERRLPYYRYPDAVRHVGFSRAA